MFVSMLFFIFSVTLTLLFFLYGFNHYYLLNSARKYRSPVLPESQMDRPAVSIHIPIYNEKYVLRRVVAACVDTAEAYGKERVNILILDDSDDETVLEVDQIVREYQANHFQIEAVRRGTRKGFKAGALQAGLNLTKEDFIAIFDADFIPSKDFLLRTLPYFDKDDRLAIVQGRWSFNNKDQSLLTQSISHIIDVHFLIEQPGRYAARIFQNFNGSGGVIRKKAILDAGGWQADTLAEDLDLSYRMQMLGYRMVYLKDLLIPGEIPPTVLSFKLQQGRWANGTLKTAMKLLPGLLFNHKFTVKLRLQALIHLTGYMIQPLMVMSFLLSCAAAIWGINIQSALQASTLVPTQNFLFSAKVPPFIMMQNLVWLFLTPFIGLCTFAPWVSLVTTLKVQKLSLSRNLVNLLILILLCFGISLSVLQGAIRAFFTHRDWEWNRTPKNLNLKNYQDEQKNTYRLPFDMLWIWELTFVLTGLWAIVASFHNGNLAGLFILIPFTIGYAFVCLFSIPWPGKVQV